MCLIAVAFDASRDYPLVVAANRDERHARPTAPAHWWDEPRVLAGRDLAAGGTWLGVDRAGRFGAVTNFHEPGAAAGKQSRGALVSGFFASARPAGEVAGGIDPDDYAGFNLLLYDGETLLYASNRAQSTALAAGVHAFSNAHPAVDWPKVRRARDALAQALERGPDADALLEMLADRPGAANGNANLRHALFVRGDDFGTRSSSVLLARADGQIEFVERRYAPDGEINGESRFEFARAAPR